MNPGGMGGSLVAFENDESALSIHDELEGVTQRIEVDSPIEPKPALTELFYFPVDAAVSFRAEGFTIASCAGVLLRNETGAVVSQPTDEPDTPPRGTYHLELTGPIKCYLRLPDVEVTVGYCDSPFDSPIRVTLDGERTVTVGARSQHSRPEATITVPDDPAARMTAFSYLGSSIKEFSPERSWPTLRGYPPRIERGTELDVPSTLAKPDTGITVTVPETHADVYRIAPLAFYLGATVEPGPTPELRLPNGYAEPLVTPARSLEESVQRIVTKCFLLDVLARQDGYTPITVRSYSAVGPYLSFYPEGIADDPLEAQLLEYLEAPDGPVFDVLPHWPAAAVLRPDPADVTLVPHLLDSMAFIWVAEDAHARPPATMREGPSSPIAVGYSHDEVPAGGVGLSDVAFDNDLNGTTAVDVDASVAFVTDDPRRAELLHSHLDHAPVNDVADQIDVHLSPTAAELRSVLTAETDLLLLDLPTSPPSEPGAAGTSGLLVNCSDGTLDLLTLPTFSPRAVLLDGARSPPTLARSVIAAGATVALVAPAVTEPDPGLSVLGCLLCGWSLAGTARLHFPTRDYQLAGVPAATPVSRTDGNAPECYIVDRVGPDSYSLRYVGAPVGLNGIGGVIRNGEAFSHDEYQLLGSVSRMPSTVSANDVRDLLADVDLVVVLNGDVYANEVPPSTEFVHRSVRKEAPENLRNRGQQDDSPADWMVK